MSTSEIQAAVEAQRGDTPEELLGRDFLTIVIPPSLVSKNRAWFESVLAGKRYARRETEHRRKDGTPVYLSGSTVARRDAAGRAIGLAGCAIDITKRREAEHARADSLSLLATTLDATADGILVMDLDGRFVEFNQRFADRWRLPAKVLEPRDLERAMAFVLDQLREPERFVEKVRELFEQPEEESHDVLEFKDGRVFERLSRPRRAGGATIGRVCSFRDVTARKRAERELRLLLTATRSIAEAPRLEAALESVLRLIGEETGWTLGQAWMPSPDGRRLECAGAWYAGAPGFEGFRAASEGRTFAPGEGLPGRVRKDGAPAWIRPLFISAYSDEAIADHAQVEAGAAFLQKPFGSETLAWKLREVLGEKGPGAPGAVPTRRP